MEKNDRENMDVEKRENRAVTESLTRIKGEAFCERTVLCIPRHFTRIGEEAFRENQRIERLEVPKIVTCIRCDNGHILLPNQFYRVVFCSVSADFPFPDSQVYFSSLRETIKNRQNLINVCLALFPS